LTGSNIIDILSSFSKEELKKFRTFISGSYFNKNKNVSSFFDQIIKFHSDFPESKVSKEIVFAKLFPKTVYNDGLMRTLIFNLNNLLKEFIILESDDNTLLKKEIILLKEYNKKKLKKLFLKKFEELNSILDKAKIKDDEYFMTRIKMQREMEIFIEINRFGKKDYNQFKVFSVKNMSENLTNFIYLTVISYNSLMFEESADRMKELSTELLNIVKDKFLSDEIAVSDNPILNLNKLQIMLHKYGKGEYYKKLKEIFINKQNETDHFERYNLHNVLQHYCINKIFEGKPEYRRERFELYKIALGQKLFSLYEKDYFDDMLFGNIVLVAISVDELDWLKDFIEKYSHLLSPEVSNSVKKYSFAKLNFAQNNFSEALKLLNSSELSNYVRNNFSVRDLIMKSMYELGYFTELYYQFDAYSQFLRKNRKNIGSLRFNRATNFLIYFRKLVKVNENTDLQLYSEIEFELNNNTEIMERTWLQSKLAEIKKM